MNKSMKKFLTLFSFAILFALTSTLQAQPPDPGGGQDPPAGVPIDGGLSLLLAAGVGYGAKKYHDMNKKNQEED